MNEWPKLRSQNRAANHDFWVHAARSKPRCLGKLNIPITPSSFRNFGKEQLGTDFGKSGLKASIGVIAADGFAIRVPFREKAQALKRHHEDHVRHAVGVG